MTGITNPAATPASAAQALGETASPARLDDVAQAVNEISRSTCLLALNIALAADEPAKLGKTLVETSRDVRQLAARSASSLADLQMMLHAAQKGEGVNLATQASIDDALAAFTR